MVLPLGNEAKPQIVPWATYLLIALNVAGFGLELARPLSFSIAYAVTPYEISHGVDIAEPFLHQVEPTNEPAVRRPDETSGSFIHQAPGPRPIWLTLITALFLHADAVHLTGNLLFLFLFGQRIEEAFGRLTYLGFFLACGVVGTLTQVMVAPESLRPNLGASGAIAGVMGAYLVWFPRDRVRVLFINVLYLIPAYGVIGCWIALQVLKGYFLAGMDIQAGNIAYVAHLGGAATGIVVSVLLWFLKPDRNQAKQADEEPASESNFLRSSFEDDPIAPE